MTKEKFKKIYLHRPTPVRIEDNIYIFRCSYAQAIQYFCRFGNDAYVVSPRRVRDEIQYFYKKGFFAYKNRPQEGGEE